MNTITSWNGFAHPASQKKRWCEETLRKYWKDLRKRERQNETAGRMGNMYLTDRVFNEIQSRGEMTIDDLACRLKVKRDSVDDALRRDPRIKSVEKLHGVSIWGLA